MKDYRSAIENSGLNIYSSIDPENKELYIPTDCLQKILSNAMVGLSLEGYALKSRSKVVKTEICKALGYPVPKSFKKTQPRFPGQNFDTYTQQSLNVQIWNEDIDANRRYVFFRVDENFIITAVKIITGEELAKYDRTGTLTRKYQATMNSFGKNICSNDDTETIRNWIDESKNSLKGVNPNSIPKKDQLLSISTAFNRLLPMVGKSIDYLDAVQERNRGAELHAMICEHLGYSIFEDDGTYPDIFNQLLEIKLQTSPTIDLGLHSPEDGAIIVSMEDTKLYSQDVRYAIFDGEVSGEKVNLKNLYLVTGEDFTNYFPLFQGKGTNAKLQLPLPSDFFD